MTYSDYKDQVMEDFADFVGCDVDFAHMDYCDCDRIFDMVYGDAVTSITGADGGGYYGGGYEGASEMAAKSLHDLLWTREFTLVVDFWTYEMGEEVDFMDPDALDVLVRKYVVLHSEADMRDVFDDMWDEMVTRG